MTTRQSFLAFAVLVGCLAVAVRGSQDPQPSFRSGVELVTVDVTVLTRGGEPVTDLESADFTVTVNGTPRRVVSAKLVQADPSRPPDTPAPPADTRPVAGATARLFVIVVDRDHIPAGEGQQMLRAAAEFIDRLPPGDRVALWNLPASSGALSFTEDRDALKARLREATGTYRPPMIGGLPGRNAFNISRDEAVQIGDGRQDVLNLVIERECPAAPRDPETPPTGFTRCPELIPAEAQVIASDAHQRAQATLTGLLNVIQAVGSIDAPKHLVLISGGPVNGRTEFAFIDAVSAEASRARVTVHALQVALGSSQARTDAMRASGTEIDQSLSAAYFLAGMTGGLAITPASGEVGFDRLGRELSASYLIAFEPEPGDRDGKIHPIDVRVRGRGVGSMVRARRSFKMDPGAPVLAAAPTPAAAPEPAPADEPAIEEYAPGTDMESLQAALALSAERFEEAAAAVVAEERYVQIVHPWRGTPKGPDGEPALQWTEPGERVKGGPTIARRQLLSDMLLVQVKTADWMGYRDVAVVDGQAVRNREERVRSLFLSGTPDSLMHLRRIADESARYNLGDFRRTMNLPTVALSFMRKRDQPRFQFKRLKDETLDGRPARVLGYTEKARPTLIQTPDGGYVPIYGRVWLDAEKGHVLRTELRFDRGGERRSLLRVDYRLEPTVALFVPVRMWEWHEGADQFGRIGSDKTLVQALATYGGFRRFRVETSEVPK